jgi:glycerate kinase
VTALGGTTAGATAHDPLGREIAAGFALVEEGGTAIVEVAEASGLGRLAPGERDAEAASSYGTGELIAAAAQAGAAVVLVAAGGSATTDGGAGAIAAIGSTAVCTARGSWSCATSARRSSGARRCSARRRARRPMRSRGWRAARRARRDVAARSARPPDDRRRGRPGRRAVGRARRAPRAGRVLRARRLDFDARMRAARAVVVGEGRIDATTLEGKVCGEIAVRARQAGVPCHAVCGQSALSPFDQRILDIQHVVEAPTLRDLEAAGEYLAESP